MTWQVDLHFEGAGGVAGQLSEHYAGGYAVLTSNQLIWVDSSASTLPGRSCSIPLDAIQEAVLRSPLLWAAPKLCLRIRTNAAGHPMHNGTYNEQVRTLRMLHRLGAWLTQWTCMVDILDCGCAGKRDMSRQHNAATCTAQQSTICS